MTSNNPLEAQQEEQALCYEEGMQALEGLTARMNEGGLSLEESIRAYEEGMALASKLEELLESQRRRIEQIDPETAEVKPFEGE